MAAYRGLKSRHLLGEYFLPLQEKNSTLIDEESKSSQSQGDKEKENLTDEDSNGDDDFSQRPKETDEESDDGDTIKLPGNVHVNGIHNIQVNTN